MGLTMKVYSIDDTIPFFASDISYFNMTYSNNMQLIQLYIVIPYDKEIITDDSMDQIIPLIDTKNSIKDIKIFNDDKEIADYTSFTEKPQVALHYTDAAADMRPAICLTFNSLRKVTE